MDAFLFIVAMLLVFLSAYFYHSSIVAGRKAKEILDISPIIIRTDFSDSKMRKTRASTRPYDWEEDEMKGK